MKRYSFLLLLLLILAGCQSVLPNSSGNQHVVIDWVDFIKWDDKEYSGLYSAVLSDKDFIGEKIGEVQFNVSKNVHNPSYHTKNGDAAFHDKGTELYEVKGFPEFMAVESAQAINGYDLYYARGEKEYGWNYKDMSLGEINKIEIYRHDYPMDAQLVNEITNQQEMDTFLQYLENSQTHSNFQPRIGKGYPIIYDMVFYTGTPFAYKFTLHFDGKTYFWHPWDTNILSDDIEKFIKPQDNDGNS